MCIPSFPTFLEFKVLHGIGHVNISAIDSGIRQSPVQQFSRGSDERMTLNIFLVAGLLADQYDSRRPGTLPETRLASRACTNRNRGKTARHFSTPEASGVPGDMRLRLLREVSPQLKYSN